MNILMLTPYLPYPLLSGGQIRTYNLLKQLSRKHEVTLFALVKDWSETEHSAELEKYCSSVRVFKRSNKPFTLSNIIQTAFSSYPFLVIRNHVPEVITAVQTELQRKQYDLIHAETFYMMPHIPPTTIPTILVEQTIEYVGYESYAQKAPKVLRGLLNIDIAKIRKWETHYWRACDTLIVMSEEDKAYIARQINNNTKIEVVANGVDTKWFAEKKHTKPSRPTILCVGTFKWLPNVEAVWFLVKEIWPKIKQQIPTARLWIVGNAPAPDVLALEHSDASITVTGTIPDIRDAFTQSDLLIAPVLSGKGTRYKVLEALASGTPVVATETAVEGLALKNGTHVLAANAADDIARLVVELLNSKSKREKLAEQGRAFVKKHYDWSLISQKLDAIYRHIGKGKNQDEKTN